MASNDNGLGGFLGRFPFKVRVPYGNITSDAGKLSLLALNGLHLRLAGPLIGSYFMCIIAQSLGSLHLRWFYHNLLRLPL